MVPQAPNNNPLADRFYAGLEHLSELMLKTGIDVKPYPEDGNRTIFPRYDEVRQLRVLLSLENYISICERTMDDGFTLKDPRAFNWRILKYMNYTVKDDLLNYQFENDDFVELYGMDGKLLFADIRFFATVSYSLMDLYCHTWEELYEREPEMTAYLAQEAEKILSGQVTETIILNIREHRIAEIFSPLKLHGWAKPKLFSPCYHNGKLAGFLDVIRLRPNKTEE
jgi:hypothetical protein